MPMKRRDPSSSLPLTPAVFHVLLSLAGGESHGYSIIKEIESRTGGTVRLSTGTLYSMIKRLLADGLIEEARTRPPRALDDERRRYYRLTPFGRAVAEAETARLAETLAMARARKLTGNPKPV